MDTQTGILQSPQHFLHLHGAPANVDSLPNEEADATPLDVAAVGVRRLNGTRDIGEIQFLRSEIDLELHRRRDPHFVEHEKKEIC
jgi:hypothetical protein